MLRSRREQTLTMVLPLPGSFIFAIVQGNSLPLPRFGTRLHRQEVSSWSNFRVGKGALLLDKLG